MKTESGKNLTVAQVTSLEVRGLAFSYGDRLGPGTRAGSTTLADVNLEIPAGKIVAIVGPNGCGKSTLLKLLCGQLKPAAGQVIVQPSGEVLAKLSVPRIAQLMALVPQNTSVGFAFSVRQMVLMGRWAVRQANPGWASGLWETSAWSRDDVERAEAAMQAMDVQALATRPITQLSGGERQRVIVARALAQDTPIMLLDEPTSALDLSHQMELLEQLRTLAHAGQKTIVLVTHDLNLALEYADQAVVLERGRVVASGAVRETLTPAVLEAVYNVRMGVGNARVLTFQRRGE